MNHGDDLGMGRETVGWRSEPHVMDTTEFNQLARALAAKQHELECAEAEVENAHECLAKKSDECVTQASVIADLKNERAGAERDLADSRKWNAALTATLTGKQRELDDERLRVERALLKVHHLESRLCGQLCAQRYDALLADLTGLAYDNQKLVKLVGRMQKKMTDTAAQLAFVWRGDKDNEIKRLTDHLVDIKRDLESAILRSASVFRSVDESLVLSAMRRTWKALRIKTV